MPAKIKSATSTAQASSKGRNRKDPKDALKLVEPGGRAGFVSADKVLISFEDGSKGVYWATPAEKKRREVARKSKAKKKGKKRKSATKAGKKRGHRKAVPSKARGKPRKRILGMPNLRDMSNEQLTSMRKAVDAELAARIDHAEMELAGLKKAAS